MRIAIMCSLLSGLALSVPIVAPAAAQAAENLCPVSAYSVRPDPRDCGPFPECGGYFLYEIVEITAAFHHDLCAGDFPFAGYVVRSMCQLEDGSLAEFAPSCNQATLGSIEPDPDYKGYNMLLSPSCEPPASN